MLWHRGRILIGSIIEYVCLCCVSIFKRIGLSWLIQCMFFLAVRLWGGFVDSRLEAISLHLVLIMVRVVEGFLFAGFIFSKQFRRGLVDESDIFMLKRKCRHSPKLGFSCKR